jgi:hypothetical protein
MSKRQRREEDRRSAQDLKKLTKACAEFKSRKDRTTDDLIGLYDSLIPANEDYQMEDDSYGFIMSVQPSHIVPSILFMCNPTKGGYELSVHYALKAAVRRRGELSEKQNVDLGLLLCEWCHTDAESAAAELYSWIFEEAMEGKNPGDRDNGIREEVVRLLNKM